MAGELDLLRDFAIIMGVALVATLPLRLLRQPPVLGYLAAGILLAPFVLPQFSVNDLDTIRRLGEIGLVLLLFAIGLEFGWQRIREVGLRVAVIALVEMAVMIAVVYQIALGVLGMTRTEALFLGAALAISSSAVLVKVLADSGQLRTVRGQIIVGILVIEDFGAVILLSVLSGVSAGGAASFGEAGGLAVRLTLFTGAALVFGALFAPRLVSLVARVRSQEALLIAGLALAFGLALIGQEFGLAPAAGAFLIGAVLGDTRHSESLNRIIAPVRDMFAALFFVSIGLLVDVREFADFLIPALVLGGVVLIGKVIANTVVTFFTGSDAKTALSVGLGMPQPGEFSLAMVKVGVDSGVVAARLNPVVIVAMALMSVIYPFVFRATGVISTAFERASPRLLRYYVSNLGIWFAVLRRAFTFPGLAADDIRRAGRLVLINLAMVSVVIATGTVLLAFTSHLTRVAPVAEATIGLFISGAILALCIPPGIALWRQTNYLADALTRYLFERATVSPRLWRADDLRRILRNTLVITLIVAVAIWTIPFVFRLLDLGGLPGVLPAIILLLTLVVMVGAAFRIHGVLEHTFGRTLLGPPPQAGEQVGSENPEGKESPR
ncbi:MAG: cation:proton antiporter [Chloroflexi bacterium]|nr:cation:proton antiporter [Chloroflexota bacterium]